VARLAKEVMALDTEIADTETMIEDRFRRHRHAEIILSMPGFGIALGAEFLAATGGDLTAFDEPSPRNGPSRAWTARSCTEARRVSRTLLPRNGIR
jgi:transposase